MQRIIAPILALCLVLWTALPVGAESPRTVSPGEITATAALLMDAETGQVLYEKNPDKRLYPASTTKIMTGLLAVELLEPGELMTAQASAIDPIPRYTSHISLDYEEQLTVRDGLYALMLPSANDAANVLAEHAAGSQEAFVELMNQRAQALGATGTHFANPHGLHDDDHYTTARDLALITREAWRQGGLMEYMGTARQTMGPTNKQSEARTLHNQHFMLVPTDRLAYYPDVIGGKVGYTDEAGHTMSTIARRDGRTLICIVLETGFNERFLDTELLLDYGFDQFTPLTITAQELTGGEGDLIGEDTTLLLHRSLSPEAVQIQVDPAEPAVSLRATGAAIPGLPEELLRLPLEQVVLQTGSIATARSNQDQDGGFRLPGFVLAAGKVLLWTAGILAVLIILLRIRRNIVLRNRRKRRQERMQRIRERQSSYH